MGVVMLISVGDFCAKHNYIGRSTIRRVIARHNERLEAFGAIIRIGRRVLVDEEKLVDFFSLGLARRLK